MRLPLLASFPALAVLAMPALSARQDPASPAALADARAALGGDAALGAVTSFVVTGSLVHNTSGVRLQSDIEIDCVVPSQYVRVERRVASRGPLGSFVITSWHGFNVDTLINRTEAPGADIPVVIDPNPPTTPQEADDRAAKGLAGQRRAFAKLALALFATTFKVYPVTFTAAASPNPAETGAVFDVAGADGLAFQLAFDAATRLPARISWMAKPIVSATIVHTTTVTSRGDVVSGPPGTLPPGDPTAGLAEVPWQQSIGDFRVESGLNLPHRLTTTVDGKPYEDIKIDKYKINVKIDPKKFKADR
ncbi:MAG TPA: hypothetical protein VJN96_22635 [Vicinamibacterales bacterium]|nr:hypothetical protein [Vicinamibacterales bacterium]